MEVEPVPSSIPQPMGSQDERDKTQKQIKALQSALNALPEDAAFATERNMLTARIKEAKQRIINGKPI
eukprot:46255-Karenia_brevis.AAC.1